MLQVMDTVGIARSAAIAGGSLSPEKLSEQITKGGGLDIDIDNAALAAECARSDGRLLPFFFANPHRGAEPYQSDGGRFYGLKLGPAVHGVPLRDPRTLSLVEVAQGWNHPVYLHCLARPGFEVSDLVELARQFPRVVFILGHAGVGNCDLYAVGQIRESRNIFFETSGGFSCVIESAYRQLGPERILFGTEYPLQHPRVEIEKALCLELDTPSFEAMMGGNFLRLIDGKGGWQ